MFSIHTVSIKTECIRSVVAYGVVVPKLWSDTIEAHRRDVRQAILDTTWALANEHGPASVKMSEIAEKTGIGRATLYKYFPDVDAILTAWHHRQINRHLTQLAKVRDQTDDPGQRLHAVLRAYAHIHQQRVRHHRREPHGHELATLLHSDDQVSDAQQQLHRLIRDLLNDAAQAGHIRHDVPPDELATYCLHALTAASALPSDTAVHRLVTTILDGLRPTH